MSVVTRTVVVTIEFVVPKTVAVRIEPAVTNIVTMTPVRLLCVAVGSEVEMVACAFYRFPGKQEVARPLALRISAILACATVYLEIADMAYFSCTDWIYEIEQFTQCNIDWVHQAGLSAPLERATSARCESKCPQALTPTVRTGSLLYSTHINDAGILHSSKRPTT